MKLSIFFILTVLCASATCMAQNVTLSVKDESLIKVFTKLRKQTGYDFVYSDQVVAISRPVTLAVKDMPLQNVLPLCMKGQQLTYTIIAKTIAVKYAPSNNPNVMSVEDRPATGSVVARNTSLPLNGAATQDSINVHGRVIDVDGNPLPGAVIMLKATGYKRATSDESGFFSIKNVWPYAQMTVAKTGYVVDVFEINNNTNPVFSLQKTTANNKVLEEVVITGYQSLSKATSPVAVS